MWTTRVSEITRSPDRNGVIESVLRPLPSKGTIGICAPAGPVNTDRLQVAVRHLISLGYGIKLTDNVGGKQGFLSAADSIRCSELESLFADEEVDLVWCARGGVGTSRLLPMIDYRILEMSRKPFAGFSDLTALQWAMWSERKVVSFSGPLAVEFESGLSEESRDFALNLLSGASYKNWLASFPQVEPQVLRTGAREIIAPMLPGNLTMISSLLGTRWMPDLRGVILVIEDVSEPPYRVDRLIFHLRNAGVLQNLAALVVGDFGWSGDEAEGNYELLRQSVLAGTIGTSYPILTNFPYGHGAVRMTLPVGTPMRLTIQSNTIGLSYGSSPFELIA